jgi:hypothetical protein
MMMIQYLTLTKFCVSTLFIYILYNSYFIKCEWWIGKEAVVAYFNVLCRRPRWSSGYRACHWNRFAASYPAEDDELLIAIQVHSTTFFWGKVNLSAPCRKILGMLKIPIVWERYLVGKIRHFFPSFSSFARRCLCWYLPESCSEWIKNDYKLDGHTVDQKVVAMHGTICTITPWNINQ